jgi:hypothetical protein
MIDMDRLDEGIAHLSRRVAERTARRGLLARLGRFALVVAGASVLEVLPIGSVPSALAVSDCNNWLNCGMNGYPCDNCGGSTTVCPGGTGYGTSWSTCCCDGGGCKIIQFRDCCYSGSTCCRTPHGGAGAWCCATNGSGGGWCANGPAQPTWCSASLNCYKCTLALNTGVNC